MSIKGLTDRGASFPRIGILRKGAPRPQNGKRPGSDLDHFRFDCDDEKTITLFQVAYGNEPRNINLVLAFPDLERNFEAWQEAWVQGGLVHRCDGEICALWRTEDGIFSQEPKPCPGGCSPVGRLKIIVPELKRFGYVEVQTGSKNDIIALQETLEAILSLRGDLRGIPMTLSRTLRNISTPGKDSKRLRRDVWLLTIEPQRQWVEAQLTSMERAALPGPARPLIVDGVTGEIVEPEAEPPRAGSGAEQPASGATTWKGLPRPWPAEVVIEALHQQAQSAKEKKRQPNEGVYGACLGIMEVAGDRTCFLRAVFSVGTAKDLTPFQRRALTDWIKPTKDDATGEWIPAKPSVFQQEFNAVVEARLAEEGQQPLPEGETQGAFNGAPVS